MARMVHSIQHLLGHKLGHICMEPSCKSLTSIYLLSHTSYIIIIFLRTSFKVSNLALLCLHCPLKHFQNSSPTFKSVRIKFICTVNTLSQHKGLHLRSAHFCIHGRVNPCNPPKHTWSNLTTACHPSKTS